MSHKRDTSELLARDLERIAEDLRTRPCEVAEVDSYGSVGKRNATAIKIEIEWHD